MVMFILQLCVVFAAGEYPLNDDWVASLAVQRTLATGVMTYPAYLATYHLMPILAGLVMSVTFGFSFTLLRILGIGSGVVCVVLVYRFLRRNGCSRWECWLCAMLLWFNPLFFNLSYTFMSDVPALLFLLAAVVSYQRGFIRGDGRWLLTGSLFAVAGFFTRQVLLLILLTAALQYILSPGRRMRSALLAFGLPLLGTIALAIGLKRFGIAPGEVAAKWLPQGWSYFCYALGVGWAHTLMLSLFMAPVTIAAYVKNVTWFRNPLLWVAAVGLGTVAWISSRTGYLFPGLGNIIHRFGLGPAATVLQGESPIFGPPWLYTLGYAALAAMISFHFFAFAAFMRDRQREDTRLGFLWLFSGIYFLLILFVRSFDRYLLLLLPALLWYGAKVLERFSWSRTVAFALTFALGALSMLGTRNYLAWNQARWALGNRLLASGVPVEHIEGGYEWDGWHLYYATREKPLGTFTPEWAPWYVKQLTPGHQMEYIISFSPLGGYRVVDREPVRGGPFGAQELYASVVQPGELK